MYRNIKDKQQDISENYDELSTRGVALCGHTGTVCPTHLPKVDSVNKRNAAFAVVWQQNEQRHAIAVALERIQAMVAGCMVVD